MHLKELMHTYQQRVNQSLVQWLPMPTLHPVRLHQAMHYAVLNGGKRVRPLLVYLTGTALDVKLSSLDAPACAVELIHAYSLVHDDLPALDNDDLRRGVPTCHKAFDEATAILAGDALQTLAFYVLSHDKQMETTLEKRLEMLNTLAIASGSRGMAGGQAIDMDAVGKQLNLVELENMHIHKTGALIRASVKMGALACPTVGDDVLTALDHYAKCVGLAFQIQDDVLDVEGDTTTLGKPQGSDQAQDKPTYPALLGLAESKRLAQELIQQALESVQTLDSKADPLRWLAQYIIQRTH